MRPISLTHNIKHMIPRRITTQTILSRSSWKEIRAVIGEYWDKDYYITDFDYGEGCYRVVMSKGTGWNGQAIRFGSTFPKDEIRELWGKDYYITNVSHDGTDWIVIMSGVSDCETQTWFTNTNWGEFKGNISECWDKYMVVSKIACKLGSTPVYCGIASKMTFSQGQEMKYFSGKPTAEIGNLVKDGRIITDMYNVDGGVMAITASRTGWTKQYVDVKAHWETAIELIKRYWDKDYSLTSLCYYQGYWVIAMSK